MPTETISQNDSETSGGTIQTDISGSDLTKYQDRQRYLNDLRDAMLKEGIQNIGQLDTKLALVNQQIALLS